MTKHDAHREVFKAKEDVSSMYFGSYELPSGKWQEIAAFDTKEKAEEMMKFHANGRDWFVL